MRGSERISGQVGSVEAVSTKSLRAGVVVVAVAGLVFSVLSGGLPGGGVLAGEVRTGDACVVTPSPTWSPTVAPPDDPMIRVFGELPSWVKFTMLSCDPTKVYFQDSRRFAFHYEFATAHLDPFVGMTNEQFEAIALRAQGQRAILGAVILPPLDVPTDPFEFGIQLVRRDPYTAAEVVQLFSLARDAVQAPAGARAFYFPTFEQAAVARDNIEFLRANGVEVSSPARWASDSVVYSEGWALGRLTFVPGAEIDAAYRDGRLRATDILLTDGVPAEVPFVAGIVSLAPSTPSSHVAILAKNFGIPFVHPVFESDVARLQQLVGQRIVLRAFQDFHLPDLRFHRVDGVIDEAVIAEILALKELPPLAIRPKELLGAIGTAVADLTPADIRFVGGKAANYSVLLKSIPESTRTAAALAFDLWDAFLDQTVTGGKTLRQEIADRLAPHASFPPADVGALSDALGGVRELFRDDRLTVFSPALEDAVIAVLTDERFGFSPTEKIRFRSSTNVEDGDQFTGAGLYDSFSGCLADDLDDDGTGPSHCDATESKERGVFRAIRRVFASFYNMNAYIERLRWGVDESQVGMAVLVHHSFPDETELANGVATLEKSFSSWRTTLVTQKGAISVTNPDGSATPEEVTLAMNPDGTLAETPVVRRESSLVLLGQTVMQWNADYVALAQRLARAAEAFAAATGEQGVLDFEYKKIAGEGLVVKQIRRIPVPDATPSVTPFLLNETRELQTFQGEDSNIFSNHRSKSFWTLQTRSMWLTRENLEGGLYANATVRYFDGCDVRELSGPPSSFPGATHSFDGEQVVHSWRIADHGNPRTYRLVTFDVPTLVAPSESPVLTQFDFVDPRLEVEYDTPVLVIDGLLEEQRTTSEWTALGSPFEQKAGDLVQDVRLRVGGVTVRTRYVWPEIPNDFIIKTFPLARWIETTITGLASQPIVLHGEFSQSYRPEHHNFSEHYMFESRLEPGMSPDIIEELEQRGIRVVHVFRHLDGNHTIKTHGTKSLGNGCACVETPRGDVNDDGAIDLSDAVFVLRHLFSGGEAPRGPADVNGDGDVNIADPIYLLAHLFLGGPAPVRDCR